MDGLSKDPPPKHLQPEVRVQIMNLMDTYDKRTKKLSGKYEYRLGSSEVTIVARASDEIKRVRVYVQRCPEAAVRTQDTVGKSTLKAHQLNIGIQKRNTTYPSCPIPRANLVGPTHNCKEFTLFYQQRDYNWFPLSKFKRARNTA